MVLKIGNKVKVDFLETGKDSKEGVLLEVSELGITIEDDYRKIAFIPMGSISEIVLLEKRNKEVL